MIRNGIGNIRNDAARRQLEVAAGVRREELNNQAAAMGQNMMAQAETLPSGILASSPELQQTAMAMANGGPVQRFANGNQVRAGRKLTLSDLYRTPLATSEDESIYGGDPAELPTLRAAAMREGVGSFFGNIPRQAAEFIASKPRFRPEQFADLFGVSSARAQDMGLPTDLNVPDPIVNEAFTPSVSLTDTGRDRADQRRAERFFDPQVTSKSPVSAENVDPERAQIALADEQEEFDAADERFAFNAQEEAEKYFDPQVPRAADDVLREERKNVERLRKPRVASLDREGNVIPDTESQDRSSSEKQQEDKGPSNNAFSFGFINEAGGQKPTTRDTFGRVKATIDNLTKVESELFGLENATQKEKDNAFIKLAKEVTDQMPKEKSTKEIVKDIEETLTAAGYAKPAEKTVDGYNLAMIGFLIASGKDSNALTNIANGLSVGTKRLIEDQKERRKEQLDRSKLIAGKAFDAKAKNVAERTAFLNTKLNILTEAAKSDAADKRTKDRLTAQVANTVLQGVQKEQAQESKERRVIDRARIGTALSTISSLSDANEIAKQIGVPPFKNLKQAQTFGESLTSDDSPYRKGLSPAERIRRAEKLLTEGTTKIYNELIKLEGADFLISQKPEDIKRRQTLRQVATREALNNLTPNQRRLVNPR